MHGGTPINKCARFPNTEKSACLPILDGFPVKIGIKEKKKKNAIQSPCLCTLSAYETNQVQSRERKIYSLHSTRQGGRIGDAIGSCASLEFLRTGKLLGNDPVASAHHCRCSPVAPPLTSPASYGTQVDISSCGVF